MIVLALIVIFGLAGCFPAGAQSPPGTDPRPSTVVILFEGLTLEDLANPKLHTLHAFAGGGQVALMSVATAGGKTDTSALLTIATGVPTVAESTDEEGFMLRERHPESDTAAEVFRRRTGKAPPAARARDPVFRYSGIAIHTGIAALARRRLNDKLLGTAPHSALIAVAGSADTNHPARRAALLGIDRDGILRRANIGRESYEMTSDAPFGKRDSPERLAAWAINRVDADLVVIHLGDAARADAARENLTAERYRQSRAEALKGIDTLLKRLIARSRSRGINPRIFIVSPRPGLDPGGGWSRLSVVVLGRVGVKEAGGLLTSPTTRTAGLISSLDIAPSLLAWIKAARPPHMSGRPVTPVAGSHSELRRIDQLTRANARGIVPVFVGLGSVAALVVFGGLLAVARGAPTGLCAFLMLVLASFPLGMLLVVPFSPRNVIELTGYVWLVILTLGVVEYFGGLLVSQVRPSIAPARAAALILAGLTAATILADALVGLELVKYSLFSSFQISGIRFYGIGNEYMGVLIGMALLLVFLGELRIGPAAALFAVCALVIGLPVLGANAGGLIAGAVAFGSGLAILGERRAGAKTAAILAAGGLAAAFLLALIDRLFSGAGASHFGGAIRSADEQGWTAVLTIIERKVRMNAAILFNPYTLTAILGTVVVALLARGPLKSSLDRLSRDYPGWARGLPAAGWGAAAAFVFNDSGAVPAIFIIGAFLASGLLLLFALPSGAPKNTLNG